MRTKITASDLGRELAAVLDQVRRHGQSFLIERDGEVVATLEPMGAARGATWRTLAQALRGEPSVDVDFAADLEEIQRNQPVIPALQEDR